jgi:hypothetical protein
VEDTPRSIEAHEARRRFLKTCGKLAVITPPVISLMLSSSNQAYANAVSGYTNHAE